ncbi:helix-turn-helix domain-containing protein [Kordia sp. YSTF-M3]|uniref:Helix-turn-helix domain-containing protein n=1 Tax=Kordia aestuariivivens TaxID=2759037 RepID=A0ABR7Q777_9FLAO|nr:helix-turn-helix domain-containing protein [Kordia aestuariivivens]MBC8754426.1 helix-turn-helix domain-containing protein [Kordia aestuariivivens]
MLHWNLYNTTIFIGAIGLLALVLYHVFTKKPQDKTTRYFYWFLIITAIAILQYISFDIGISRKYKVISLFFLPFEFLAPVIFTAFTCAYLQKEKLFKKYKYYLLIPFAAFFLIYTVVKINVFVDYAILSRETVRNIRTEWNENLALLFTFIIGVWNYRIIKSYEKDLGDQSYHFVLRKTKWLKNIYMTLILLSVFWLLTLLYIKIDVNVGGNDTYYPLWIAYLACYYVFYIKSVSHLQKIQKEKAEEEKTFNLSGLDKMFEPTALAVLQKNQSQVITILSYFATSLFDISKTKEVLWDILENCVSKLELEDCVLYLLDEKTQMLKQEAAFGNKKQDAFKIHEPKEIPVGKGIVGSVAQTGNYELIKDTRKDKRYIIDDKARLSELAVPIYVEGILKGVLDAEHSQRNFFTENHLYLFQLIAKLTEKKLIQLQQKKGLSISKDNSYYKELCSLMEEEKRYRNPAIKLSTLSEEINISANYLSQVINSLSGHNFSDFVNSYRIKEIKSKLSHPAFIEYPVLSIGLEAGFNSKSAFYNSFKKLTGMSPTVFREKHPFKSQFL